MTQPYVHGYDRNEAIRLEDQASTLVDLLHADTRYAPGSLVLEAGCGVGAQTVTLATNSPEARFVSIDTSQDSLRQAQRRIEGAQIANVTFQQADIFDLPFAPASFDHVFVCFVLEHLARPIEALARLLAVLRPGGTITVIEGDHGSTYFHPDDVDARDAVQCQVRLQALAGGDACIGRKLFPLLIEAGFEAPLVSPRMVYVDGSRPALIDGFTLKTFAAMVRAVRDRALAEGLMTAERFDRGIVALERTAAADGVFCYTFFKGTARKARSS